MTTSEKGLKKIVASADKSIQDYMKSIALDVDALVNGLPKDVIDEWKTATPSSASSSSASSPATASAPAAKPKGKKKAKQSENEATIADAAAENPSVAAPAADTTAALSAASSKKPKAAKESAAKIAADTAQKAWKEYRSRLEFPEIVLEPFVKLKFEADTGKAKAQSKEFDVTIYRQAGVKSPPLYVMDYVNGAMRILHPKLESSEIGPHKPCVLPCIPRGCSPFSGAAPIMGVLVSDVYLRLTCDTKASTCDKARSAEWIRKAAAKLSDVMLALIDYPYDGLPFIDDDRQTEWAKLLEPIVKRANRPKDPKKKESNTANGAEHDAAVEGEAEAGVAAGGGGTANANANAAPAASSSSSSSSSSVAPAPVPVSVVTAKTDDRSVSPLQTKRKRRNNALLVDADDDEATQPVVSADAGSETIDLTHLATGPVPSTGPATPESANDSQPQDVVDSPAKKRKTSVNADAASAATAAADSVPAASPAGTEQVAAAAEAAEIPAKESQDDFNI